ncbi:uncharacterized protein BP01DRAFT_173893 [Aspergillus saccharolyticus JOP 1030-1]|uniref:Uncharacterized protein n=1 Tax=Aspergillus saccharolyticus JOP 1030-1 TaxID=1450539 RepID=A0A318ZUG1_9EURO|nr:hypothetical protein BP01DRAFT_173893 [Aspergillus saccharolyticus JOP 1030-1]PYH47973.1 hypothetical protein BP01DRAFT_173893 [Aspergillus saccharolyticus JOP 1030-1]
MYSYHIITNLHHHHTHDPEASRFLVAATVLVVSLMTAACKVIRSTGLDRLQHLAPTELFRVKQSTTKLTTKSSQPRFLLLRTRPPFTKPIPLVKNWDVPTICSFSSLTSIVPAVTFTLVPICLLLAFEISPRLLGTTWYYTVHDCHVHRLGHTQNITGKNGK